MGNVYPKIKEFCREKHGLEFQVTKHTYIDKSQQTRDVEPKAPTQRLLFVLILTFIILTRDIEQYCFDDVLKLKQDLLAYIFIWVNDELNDFFFNYGCL